MPEPRDLRPEPSAAAIDELAWWFCAAEPQRIAEFRPRAEVLLRAAYAADEGFAALRERVECLEQEKSEALVLASQRLRFIEECDETGDLLAAENERLNDTISPLNAKRNILQEELDAEARTHIHTKARRDAAERRVAELERENGLKISAHCHPDHGYHRQCQQLGLDCDCRCHREILATKLAAAERQRETLRELQFTVELFVAWANRQTRLDRDVVRGYVGEMQRRLAALAGRAEGT
jgi:hypothetical protein